MSNQPGDSDESMDGDDVAATYARHIEEAQNILQEGSSSLESIDRVRRLLEESSLLCKKERCVQETIMGGTALSICAQISKLQAQALDTNLCTFDSNSFSKGINDAIRDPERNTPQPDWRRLGKQVARLFKRAPTFSYLYGSFKPTEPPPKVRKEKTPRQRRNADAAGKKKPDQIQNVEASDQGNDAALRKLKKVLLREFAKRNNQPIGFFECVLNPDSFSRSVENIFNMSFLMRINYIRVENGANSLPMMYLVSDGDSDKIKSSRKRQCIVSITMKQWRDLVNAFNITTPMIP